MNAESRSHAENGKAYELASIFSNVLGAKPEIVRQHQAARINGQHTAWPSILDITPEGIDRPEGKWGNEQEVIDSLWERMEWSLLKVMPKEYEELPGTILTNLLAREFEGDGSWYEPNMAQHEEGGKWGLGQIVKERKDAARITPIDILIKTPVASRPVGRACNSQMKVYEQLVAGIFSQVLDDIEDETVKQGQKRIVLNSTLPYAKIFEDISKAWEKEGKKIDRELKCYVMT